MSDTGTTFSRIREGLFLMGDRTSYFDGRSIRPLSVGVVAGDRDWAVGASNDSQIHIFRLPDLANPYRSLHYYHKDPITRICVSEKLHTFAVGTAHGGVLLYPLERGRSVVVISLGDSVVESISLTPAFGFVVVVHRNVVDNSVRMALFTINGMPLRDVRLAEQVTAVAVWRSQRDFDFVAIATKSGSVIATEAYELNFQKPLFHTVVGGHILAMCYDLKSSSLAGVAADGTIFGRPIEAA
jgi:hypothetical protein